MASWNSAFATAFKIMLMSIIWAIIGIILIAIGFSMMEPIIPMPTMTTVPEYHGTGSAIIGLIIVVIGYGILLLGTLASFLKYSAEYYAKEVREKGVLYQTQAIPY